MWESRRDEKWEKGERPSRNYSEIFRNIGQKGTEFKEGRLKRSEKREDDSYRKGERMVIRVQERVESETRETRLLPRIPPHRAGLKIHSDAILQLPFSPITVSSVGTGSPKEYHETFQAYRQRPSRTTARETVRALKALVATPLSLLLLVALPSVFLKSSLCDLPVRSLQQWNGGENPDLIPVASRVWLKYRIGYQVIADFIIAT